MSSKSGGRDAPIVVGLIPARGGSTGITRKNLRLVAGRPLLWHTIQAALGARNLTRVFVSTEDEEIARYAQSLGVSVLQHPSVLSTDDSPTFPVIKWDLGELRRLGIEPAYCAVLRATTPLRSSDDINASIDLLTQHRSADSVVSVCEAVGVHPVRLKRIVEDGMLKDAFENEGSYPRRRQEFERLYMRNGGIYLCEASVIDAGGLWGSHCLAYVMPQERSLNINTDFELQLAELLIKDMTNSSSPQDRE